MPSTRVVMAGTGFAAVRQFLIEALPDAQLDQVEVATLRAKGHAADVMLPAMSRIDGALMDRIEGLRLIQQWGAGLEGVDIAAATERKIAVANVPTPGTGNAESVAEWCVMAAIAISRRLPLAQETICTGGTWGTPLGRALMGRTAGIVGLGGIGQALASRLRPFGMRLVGLQRRPEPALAERLGMEWVGGPERLAELLRRSDYLFLCVPLSEQTRQIIDETALAMLPSQACIINAARGGLLSTEAMLRALAEGRLIGAGLDVFEQEPLDPASPLLGRADVIATSHIAGVTDVSYRGIARGVVANIVRILAGQAPLNCVNWEALAR
ncbi:MAG TPA: 2-hydroxyacid dehydrogenase [Candidatus Binataceae bacterium]|jgi:phosphoglycerate dehydrogenase-like enzyme|nr:2-hydroxyacid dehydrogenase [Candidatus Binataceae bacterium]